MLEYLDDVLGRLFDFMNTSKLRENTYIFIMSDNGSELFPTERNGVHKLVRQRQMRLRFLICLGIYGWAASFLTSHRHHCPASIVRCAASLLMLRSAACQAECGVSKSRWRRAVSVAFWA